MLDLFTPIVPEAKMHPNFLSLLGDKDVIKVVQKWAVGFKDRDNKFVYEFQTTFNSSFWELYLHAIFKKLKFKTDGVHYAPDFCLDNKGYRFLVEAVSTSHPQGGTPEHDRIAAIYKAVERADTQEERDEEYRQIVALATERITNSIASKYRKYLNQYSKLEHVAKKPFILAVGAFEQPFFYKQKLGAILRVLYGTTEAKYIGSDPYFEHSEFITKSNGSQIPIGLFNDDKHKYISAIIFNPTATVGKARVLSSRLDRKVIVQAVRYDSYSTVSKVEVKPVQQYQESLLDGTTVFLNPYSVYPFEKNLFRNPDIAIFEGEQKNNMGHGFLFSREVITVK
ncbi:hypothetical protein [Paenibacillus tepidiphilus]|uniref:hypothetical protein n=1 Tax=Paenibacillus tepidiphilus TaxID=2608683 RepID=UPI00123847CD|nr:hypothetical protein [Paenibacillus tepidiphilus]